MIESFGLLLAGLTILGAGTVKGVVGIGAPLVAVPLLATIYDVPTAIAVMTIPLLVSSSWQMWANRGARLRRGTLLLLLSGCVAGVVIGTLLLGVIPHVWLDFVLAALVFGYVAIHLGRPDIVLSQQGAHRAAAPVGVVTGILQGAAGVSTPVSVTFVLAQHLKREAFLFATQSIFTVMAVTQILSLSTVGIMTPELGLASLAALVPMMVGTWLGQYLGHLASQRTFERLTLAVLVLIAISLVADGLSEALA